jgi:hypothetical protein
MYPFCAVSSVRYFEGYVWHGVFRLHVGLDRLSEFEFRECRRITIRPRSGSPMGWGRIQKSRRSLTQLPVSEDRVAQHLLARIRCLRGGSHALGQLFHPGRQFRGYQGRMRSRPPYSFQKPLSMCASSQTCLFEEFVSQARAKFLTSMIRNDDCVRFDIMPEMNVAARLSYLVPAVCSQHSDELLRFQCAPASSGSPIGVIWMRGLGTRAPAR